MWWTFLSLCHYISNHLTSATICLSYLSHDVYLSRAYIRVTVALPPTPSYYLSICLFKALSPELLSVMRTIKAVCIPVK